MFKQYNFSINLVARPFDNLKYRERTCLLVCKNSEGKYLLGASNEYPKGIVRLMGGGVDKGEDLLKAAIREVKEETGAEITESELEELAAVKVEGVFEGITYTHTVYLYFLNSSKDDLVAGDDVSEVVQYTEEDFNDLISRFKNIDDNLMSKGDDPYSWGDYGKVYAFVHQVALDETKSRGF